MSKCVKSAVVSLSLLILTLSELGFAAQKPKPIPVAPIPAQILSAKKVFLGNAGGDQHVSLDGPSFEGGHTTSFTLP
jgi:hypothetical protein